MEEKKSPSCVNCGKCCYYFYKGQKVKCPYLKRLKDGRTKCIRYYQRLGLVIGPGVTCTERKLSRFNYVGCPMNSLDPNKPMFPEVEE